MIYVLVKKKIFLSYPKLIFNVLVFCENVDIDGQEDMKLICGTTVVEGKGNQGKADKVIN